MRRRTVAALAIGYVIGTRAGRERYEQILEAGRHAADRLQEGQYEPLLEKGRELADRLQGLGGDVAATRRGSREPGRRD